MPSKQFAANITKWVATSKARIEQVYTLSVAYLAEEMTRSVAAGGNMPVVTGQLRGSLVIIGGGGALNTAGGGGIGIQASMQGLELGGMVMLAFTAPYARRINYGFVGTDALGRRYHQRGYLFVDKAAQRWPQIVRLACAEVKGASR
jgi:hypothetical protein